MTKMARKDLIDLLGEDEAAFTQLLKTKLIHLIATDQVDMVQLARDEMANRGLGQNAEWIGFPAAAKLWQTPVATSLAATGPDDATLDAGMEVLAQVHLGIQTLKERRMDALDFHEVNVLQLKDALRAAFELGRVSK
ncbi:MAG: hypothetical protein WC326_15250 [Candidatus Delongbacteria bacterium]